MPIEKLAKETMKDKPERLVRIPKTFYKGTR
jgi:hypothetical protein